MPDKKPKYQTLPEVIVKAKKKPSQRAVADETYLPKPKILPRKPGVDSGFRAPYEPEQYVNYPFRHYETLPEVVVHSKTKNKYKNLPNVTVTSKKKSPIKQAVESTGIEMYNPDTKRKKSTANPGQTKSQIKQSTSNIKGDSLKESLEDMTAITQFAPFPLISIPSMVVNSGLGLMAGDEARRRDDELNQNINQLGAAPWKRMIPGLPGKVLEGVSAASDLTDNFGLEEKKNGGWLDNYGKKENANEGHSSAPKEWIGEGYSNVGRNYSPAWGGQFQKGGTLPPIYTDDPDLVQDYNDSLHTFLAGQENLRKLKSAGFKEVKTLSPKEYENYLNSNPQQFKQTFHYNKDNIYPIQYAINDPSSNIGYSLKKLNLKEAPEDIKMHKDHTAYFNSPSQYKELISPASFKYTAGELKKERKKKIVNGKVTEDSGWKVTKNTMQKHEEDESTRGYLPLTTKPSQPYILGKPPEPTLNKQVTHINPISAGSMTSTPGLRPMQHPDIQMSGAVPQGSWNVEYLDPDSKKTETKHFISNEDAEKFYNDPANKASRKYSNASSVGRMQLGGNVYPVNYVPQAAMGGSLPGSVGFTYARTNSPAPSNGPYAKKTKASAQDGKEVPIDPTTNPTYAQPLDESLQYVNDWMNSPMYKQMLSNSLRGRKRDYENLDRRRKSVVEDGKINYYEESIDPRIGAESNYVGKGKSNMYFNKDADYPDWSNNILHELFHITDAGGLGIPLSDKKLMYKYATHDIKDSPSYESAKATGTLDDLKKFTNYVNAPSETRARINNLRKLMRDQEVYDPFTQSFSKDMFDKYKQLDINEEDKKAGHTIGPDPYQQLRMTYTDEEIEDMMNKISKADNNEVTPIAQNGMSFYQHGLDWKPKSISKNGGWLDKYIPEAQKGLNLPGVTDFKMPLNRTDAPGLSIQEKQRQDAAALEMQRRNEATAKRQFVGQGKASTPESERSRAIKNKAYAAQNAPYVNIDENANLSQAFPDASMTGELRPGSRAAKTQEGVDDMITALEYAGYAEGLGALGSAAKKAVAQSMESGLISDVGNYLKTQTPLRKAYKLNPNALTQSDILPQGTVARQIFGDEAYQNFLKYGPTTRPGVSETQQLVDFAKASSNPNTITFPSGEVVETIPNKVPHSYPYFSEGKLWYGKSFTESPNFTKVMGKERIITAPSSEVFRPAGESSVMLGEPSKEAIQKYAGNRRVLIPGTEYTDPSKYKVYEPHWLRGYKEVPREEKGGVIKDDRGQWDHPGEITEIGSNRITMQGVPYPVLGVSDENDVQMMFPGEEYKFKGKKVTEFPITQKSNKKENGGWLSQYK